MAARDPDILIVGGGIAGLSLAGFLRACGIVPSIIERATAWRRVGWGIGLWRNGVQLLEKLGVAEQVRSRGSSPSRFHVGTSDSEQLTTIELPIEEPVFLAVHRADLHEALRSVVPSDVIRMDTTPNAIDAGDDGVRVELDDGTVEEYDAVIGADGIHSAVREQCFEDWSLEDTGTVVWSFWAPELDTVELPQAVSIMGRATEGFVIDVDGRGLVNLATKMSEAATPKPPATEQLAAVATDVGWHLPELVEALDDETELFFDRICEVEAERWYRDRVALVGDAAHAIHPISGMGAALALEDAYVLAEELAQADSIRASFARFEQRRRDRVATIKRIARIEKTLLFTDSRALTAIRNEFVRRTPLFEWFFKRQIDEQRNVSFDNL